LLAVLCASFHLNLLWRIKRMVACLAMPKNLPGLP
jgi:hypothetical protein